MNEKELWGYDNKWRKKRDLCVQGSKNYSKCSLRIKRAGKVFANLLKVNK